MKKVISVLIVIIGAILLALGVAAETAQNASLGIIGGADVTRGAAGCCTDSAAAWCWVS